MTRSYSYTYYKDTYEAEYPDRYLKKYKFKNKNGSKKHGKNLIPKYNSSCYSICCKTRKLKPETTSVLKYKSSLYPIEHAPDQYITLDDLYSNGMLIKQIIEPTFEECMVAIKQNGLAIKYIKQSPELCITAVKQNGMALQYIKSQTEQICKSAVYQNSHALKFVINQSEEIILIATKKNPFSVTYIQKPSTEIYSKISKFNIKSSAFMLSSFLTESFYHSMWEYHLYNNGMLIKHCPIQSFGLCEIAVNQNPFAIQFIDLSKIKHDHFFELCKIAVNINGLVIKHLIDINDTFYIAITSIIGADIKYYFSGTEFNYLIKTAINQNYLSFKYLHTNYQTYDICKLAVSKNPNAIIYIKSIFFKTVLDINFYIQHPTSLDDCLICYSNEKYFLQSMDCKHPFCRNCYVKLNKCPMCRRTVKRFIGLTN
jgi:hypothetical protein